MRNRLLINLSIIATTIALISWGVAGHRTVAAVAERHLTPNVKSVLLAYLKGQNIEDVSTWADEVRNQAEYKNTDKWHYLNLPIGLTYARFVEAVQGQNTENIYTAILKSEHVLSHTDNPPKVRIEALKFLIHLVGDAHQPMHVSRKEDKGGNTIQVRFDNKGTNLHSLWDSKLIEHEHLSDADLIGACDKATPQEVKDWQSVDPMVWLWESYQISSELYKEAESSANIDEAYYNKWIQVIHKRINQAGIRLAGELNRIFKNEKIKITNVILDPPPPAKDIPVPPMSVPLKDIGHFVGQNISVEGKVYGTKDVGSMVLVNVGGNYPNQLLTVVLKGKAQALAVKIDTKSLTVTGKVVLYKGKPEIVVTDSAQVSNIH
ncbi:MAG: S1/P1 nuclease [Mucilaginibacter sp.]